MILTWLILVSGILFASGQDVLMNKEENELETSRQASTIDMLREHKYKHEVHHVTTEDKYILELHRIPHKSRFHRSKPKEVVFLMHGLESSSADWVVMGPGKGLAYVLADRGYDVWMGNARGNKYSRRHETLNPDEDKKYWDFSWHEIGTIDLPTMIDYVLGETGQSQLTYVGHSQGTTSFFVMASELPQYNEKIKMMHAFAPVAYMKHLSSLFLQFVSPFLKDPKIFEYLGDGEFLPSSEFLSKFGSITCSDESLTQTACKNLYFLIAGYDPSNLNKTILPDILQNYPAGSATKQIIHYGQEIHYDMLKFMRSPKFLKFDFGSEMNTVKYGQDTPPNYPLEKVTCPVALYIGESDNLATPKDVQYLSTVLPNVVSNYLVPHKRWTHVDFIWGTDVNEMVYEKMFQVMKEQTSKSL